MIVNLGATNLGVVTSSEIATELNLRNYYLESATTPPATSPPTTTKPYISRATYIDYSVELSLNHHSLPSTSSTPRNLPSATWNSIISVAISISQQLDAQYTVPLSGLRRMAGLGIVVPPTSPSWGSVWGPIILQMIGAAATIGGQYWQAQITRQQLEATYQATTGQQLGVPTQTDVNAMAAQLAKMGFTQAQISQILATAVPNATPDKSTIPSWALPLGIGAVALVLLMQRR